MEQLWMISCSLREICDSGLSIPSRVLLVMSADVHESTGNRRKLAQSRMKPHEVPLTLTSFPRLGAPGVFTDPYHKPGGGVARSLFLPDEVINQHVRFPFVYDFANSLSSF